MPPTPPTPSIAGLDFSHAEALHAGLARLTVRPEHAGELVGQALRTSPVNGQALAHALIARHAGPGQDADANARELVRWAAAQRSGERVAVVRAFAHASRKSDLIGEVALLQRAQSRPFFQDYFSAGGDLAAVADWLREAGAVLRKGNNREAGAPPHDGFFDDMWDGIKKGVSTVVHAVGEAVNTVIDGIETAGRTVAQIFNEAARWTADRIEDLVEALVDAGKRTLDILAAAVRHGVEAIRGAVYGLLRAGRALAEVVSWAASQAASAVEAAIDAALDLGRSVAQVMAEAVKLAGNALKAVARAIIASGRKVGQVLATVAGRTAEIIRMTLEGVLAAGVNLVNTVLSVCRDVAEGFRKGFIQGLIAVGKGVGAIFLSALESGLAIAGLAFAAILEAVGGHRALTPRELAEARKVFGNSDWLTRVKVANHSWPSDFIEAVNGGRPFTTMYVINFDSKSDFAANGDVASLRTLIHELTHVWQGVVDGPIYMVQALEAQLRARADHTLPGDDEAYRYTDAQLAANQGDLSKFTREQQANIIEDYYVSRFVSGNPQPSWAGLLPYAEKVKNAHTMLEFHAVRVAPTLIGHVAAPNG